MLSQTTRITETGSLASKLFSPSDYLVIILIAASCPMPIQHITWYFFDPFMNYGFFGHPIMWQRGVYDSIIPCIIHNISVVLRGVGSALPILLLACCLIISRNADSRLRYLVWATVYQIVAAALVGINSLLAVRAAELRGASFVHPIELYYFTWLLGAIGPYICPIAIGYFVVSHFQVLRTGSRLSANSELDQNAILEKFSIVCIGCIVSAMFSINIGGGFGSPTWISVLASSGYQSLLLHRVSYFLNFLHFIFACVLISAAAWIWIRTSASITRASRCLLMIDLGRGIVLFSAFFAVWIWEQSGQPRTVVVGVLLQEVILNWIWTLPLLASWACYMTERDVRDSGILCCQTCSYILIGNLTGVCPECGTAIPDEQKRVIAESTST